MTESITSWKDRANDTLIKNLAVPQALMTRGQGCYLWDDQGNRYLDFLGGIAVNCLGHCHPVFIEALAEQAQVLGHVSNYFVSEPQLELAARLLRLSGAADGGRVFLSNSGTEANEAALKLVRLYGNKHGKKRVIALEGAFHGRTMGALSLTAKAAYREPFAPLPGGVEHIERTIEALEAAMDDNVAAVFLEPLLGEAGVVELPIGYLQAARRLTEKHQALLVIDEVQTGVGRTGRWFGFQHSAIIPDVVTLAKGMGAGFPVGAMIAFEPAADLFYPGSHGTTFGGNPLAAHVSDRVLAELEKTEILDNVAIQSERLCQGILTLESPLIKEVRGQGLLLGIVLNEPKAGQVVQAAFSLGLIINAPDPSVIRLVPPLIVGDTEVAEFLALLQAALNLVK